MQRARISRNTELIKKENRYFYSNYNKHTGATSLIEIKFDKTGKSEIRTGAHCVSTFEKLKIDILLEIENNKTREQR